MNGGCDEFYVVKSVPEITLAVFVENLSVYASGGSVGKWIELPVDDDTLLRFKKQLNVIDFEYAIHDYESNIHRLNLGEHGNLDNLNQTMRAIRCLSANDTRKLLAIYGAGEQEESLEETLAIIGEWELDEDITDWYDYGKYLTGGTIPKELETYFEFARYGHETSMSTNVSITNYGLLRRE